MSRAKHRRPRPVRDFITGLGVLWLLKWYRRHPTPPATPVEINRVGLTMADVIAAATNNYEVVEPCPWGLSAGACAAFHPSNHASRFAETAA